MKQYLRLALVIIIIGLLPVISNAQGFKEGKLWLNEDGSNYFKFTLMSQAWLRYTWLNPGSTIGGYEKDKYADVGIRRARLQAYGQIADRVFLYTQFGMNNFSYTSDRKAGFFIHDITGEYEAVRRYLSLGMGLSAWNGLSRFSSPSTGSILGLDAPLFEQSTNDVTDQFLRKLGVYAKGKIGKFDYRLVMSSPMSVQKSGGYSPEIGRYATFSPEPPKMQWQGYFKYDLLEEESNTTPYMAGTYLGQKKVFNIGLGFQYQPEAMWHKADNGDTVRSAMKNFAADIFYDAPLNGKGAAISIYAAYVHFDFGPGHIRNQATMNPANGTNNTTIINGSGNGYPSFGTGSLWYAQVGYKPADNLIGNTTLLPYVSVQYADYDRLSGNMLFWDAGVNWLLKGHISKVTIAYQSRPLFYADGSDYEARGGGRKGGVVLQYQVLLN